MSCKSFTFISDWYKNGDLFAFSEIWNSMDSASFLWNSELETFFFKYVQEIRTLWIILQRKSAVSVLFLRSVPELFKNVLYKLKCRYVNLSKHRMCKDFCIVIMVNSFAYLSILEILYEQICSCCVNTVYCRNQYYFKRCVLKWLFTILHFWMF